MAKFTEPSFEPRRLLDARKWVVVVTWGHSLRQRIDGLEFRSEMEAQRWIGSNARSWLEVEDLRLTARRIDAQLKALSAGKGSSPPQRVRAALRRSQENASKCLV